MSGNIDWLEVKRKFIHIIGGLIIVSLIYFDILKAWMVLLLTGAGIIISIIHAIYTIPLVNYFMEIFEREHLRKKFPGKGVLYLGLAITLIMLLFEKDIVLAGIMIWTFGDSMSAIVGKHYGNIKNPLNNLRVIEGTVAGIIAGGIAASFFVSWKYAFIAATIAMIIESIDWKLYREPLDDNFFVPIIGSFVVYVLMILF